MVVIDVWTIYAEVFFSTLNVTSKKVVETSATTNNSPSLDYTILDDQPTINIDSPGFRPFAVLGTVVLLDMLIYLKIHVVYCTVISLS